MQSDAQTLETLWTEQQLQKQQLLGLTTSVDRMALNVEKLTTSFGSAGKVNWQVIGVVCGILGSLIVGALTILERDMQYTIAPNTSDIARIKDNQKVHDGQLDRILETLNTQSQNSLQSTMADVQSKVDRAQLNDRLKNVEQRQADNLADRKAETAALAERSTEVETQFRAEDRIRNIQFAEQQRWNSILWNRLFPNSPYPSVTYFPEMAQERPWPLGK